jgi:Carbamoyl-phosphate synthase L chain, ATP binding domain
MVSFSRYQYPSVLPAEIKQRIHKVSKTIIEHIGFAQSAFNIEYFYEEASDRLSLLEINSRISQSHAPLFKNVDGASNHRVVVDLGLGKKPNFPYRQGKYVSAAKISARRFIDALVVRVPTPAEISHAQQLEPGATVVVPVKEGRRLSELLDQDSYSFQYAIVYLGANSIHELARGYKQVRKALPFF